MNTEINAKYQNIITKLHEKKTNYPNIIQLWETILEHRKKDLLNTLNECESMLCNIQNIDNDILKNIIFIVFISLIKILYIYLKILHHFSICI